MSEKLSGNPCYLCSKPAVKKVKYKDPSRGMNSWKPLYLCLEHLSEFKRDFTYQIEKAIESLLGKGLIKEEFNNGKQTYSVTTKEEFNQHQNLLKALRLKQLIKERKKELLSKHFQINKPILDFLHFNPS